MKVKQICMMVLLWLGVIPAVQAQTFDKLWKEVEQAEKKSLPKTVIKLTDEIYQKGEKEKNSPQMLKAYTWRMKYREMLNPDSLYADLKGLEQWVKQTDQPMDRAILHSLIAGIYADYAASNQWQLRQRTEIVDQTPATDMREWTANMFIEKVRTNIKEALADSVLLLKTSSRDYQSAVLAADDAMKGVSSAILTSTIIFMAVFFPVAMMGGTSGAFYTQFGITMAVAVGISAVNAFTLSPALCALLLKPYIDEQGNTKNNFAARFRKAFNAVFDSLSRRYVRGVMFIIHRRWLLWSIIGISFGLLVLLVNVTKTGLIPEEDTGTVMVSMNTKPGTSMAQTSKVMERINSRLDSIGEIEYSGAVAGFSFSGSGPSQAMYFVTLKDWEDRKGEGQSVNDVIGKIYAATSDIPDATVFAMSPPMIAGYGMGNGFELYLQDKAGGNIAAFKEEADKFVEALSQRPEIGEVYSSFATDYPQYWVDIDAAKCEQSGVSPADVLSTLSGYYTGQYVSDFNRFSKLYHVTMQAPAEYRVNAESLHHMYVRASDGGMSPLSRFVRLTKTNGPSDLTRFNLFNAISISGSPAQGYSSGQVLEAIGETAREVLPSNYTYEFGGISREESKTTNNATLIFLLCMVLVYLILCALYESVFIPFAVLLSVPCGLMGSFLFAWLFGLENNIYMQTGLIMIIGLLAKTAILLTEYAGKRRSEGMTLAQAAYSAAKVRLRPILMTVLSMVFGLVPLMMAHGVGANGSRSLATGVIGGMIVGTLALLFLVPSLFIVFQYIQERVKHN